MKITCLLGRHWPVAAFSEWQEGYQTSHCADCGCPMEKSMRELWKATARPSFPKLAVARRRVL